MGYSFGAWVRDMDQLTRYNNERSGVYSYQVATNGDYGSAKGLDLTLEWRWAFLGSMLQYTYSIIKTNSEYAWASISGQYVDAPSQENLAYYDRPHDLTYYLYTFLPFGIQAGLTAFYQRVILTLLSYLRVRILQKILGIQIQREVLLIVMLIYPFLSTWKHLNINSH